MSGFVVVVKVVVVVVTVVVVRVVVFIVTFVVVVEENTGEMVSVKLTSVFTVVETEAVRSFSIVVIKSTFTSWALSCTVVITAAVVIAPAETNKNIEMTFMRITTFLVFPETS